MRVYSDFFQTLYDEAGPVGNLGRGTHYSVLRAVVFRNSAGAVLPVGHYLDFAVIWDEDHDERVMEPIFKLYCSGALSSFVMLGERKAGFTGIVAPSRRFSDEDISYLASSMQQACTNMSNGDWWQSTVASMNATQGLINDTDDKVALYLRTINMLWSLGVKPISHPLPAPDPVDIYAPPSQSGRLV